MRMRIRSSSDPLPNQKSTTPLAHLCRMGSCARALRAASRGLCSQAATPPLAAAANPLLVRLLHEPESRVRIALDAEVSSAAHRDASFWEPLLAALGSSAPRKAQLVLEWKLEKLLEEDVRDQEHYSKLISFSGKLNNIPFAMNVFTSMESQGIQPNTSIFNALLSASLLTRNIATAMSLFEIMDRIEDCKPNLATYNAFISMYSKFGDSHGMMAWYSASKAAGFSPDIHTYESLIQGFIRSGKFDDADQFYKEMLSSEISPNLNVLEYMLEGLCKQKDVLRVKEFLKFVTGSGWDLSELMVEKLVRLYLELRLVEEMEELLRLLKPSLHSAILSRVHCAVIRLYAMMDRLDDMEYSIGRMLRRGMSFACPEDVEAVICSYFRQSAFTRLDLFLEQIRDSHKLTRSTYDVLVAGYRRFGLHERLDFVMKEMKTAGLA